MLGPTEEQKEMRKPASKINSWKDWPADVVDVLRFWNHYSRQYLRFSRETRVRGFVCCDCGESCEGHGYGSAEIGGAGYICDDCLIDVVRDLQRICPEEVTAKPIDELLEKRETYGWYQLAQAGAWRDE